MSRAPFAALACTTLLATACATTAPPAPAAGPGAAPSAPAPAPSAAPAAPAGAATRARAPEEILADAVQATGGAAAWRSHKTAHFKLETTFQGMGMGGTGERFATSAGKSLMVGEFMGLGSVREGTNGKVLWSQDAVMGFRFLEGAEAEEARIDAAWNADLQAKELFTKLESAIEPGPNGTPLECVIETPRAGAPIHSCYDRATHLQVLQSGIKATPQGDTPYRGVSSDWHEVGGVKIPFVAETQLGPITVVTRIRSVTFDEPMDDKMFEPPVAAPAAH